MSASKALQTLKRESIALRAVVDAGTKPEDVPVSFIGQRASKGSLVDLMSISSTHTPASFALYFSTWSGKPY